MEDWFPIELKLQVFSLLDSDSLFSVSTVCKSWNEVSEDSCIWEIHFHKYFPYISPLLLPCLPHDYKQLFKQEHAFLKRARIKSCVRELRSKYMRPDLAGSRISNIINIKMALLGDEHTGKTSFLLRYVNQQFNPDYYLTTDEDMYTCLASLGGNRVNMLLCDVPGIKGDAYEDPTVKFPVSWDGVDVFLLFFSLGNKSSLYSLVNYWAPLARRIHGIDVPLVVCGTMIDIDSFEVTVEDIESALAALSIKSFLSSPSSSRSSSPLSLSSSPPSNQNSPRSSPSKLQVMPPYVEISAKTGANVESLVNRALESIHPSFFSHNYFHEGPTLDMYRSTRQLGYDYDDDSEDDEL